MDRAASIKQNGVIGRSGRRVAGISVMAIMNGIRQMGPDLVRSPEGRAELAEQARFYGLTDSASIPGRRNRHGRVTFHKDYRREGPT